MLAALRTRAFRTLLAARPMTSTICLLTLPQTLTLHRSIGKSCAHEVAETSETIHYHLPTWLSSIGALAVAAAACR